MKNKTKVVISTLFILSLGITPAWASSVTSYGKAWYKDSYVYVKDIKRDKTAVYAEYIRHGAKGSGYVYNRSGAGNVVSKNVGSKVKTVRVCLDRWGIDACGNWG